MRLSTAFAATLVCLGLSDLASAQRHRCGTHEPVMNGVHGFAPSDCGYSTNSPQPQYEPICTYEIQVVFHVIQRQNGTGFLSASTIRDQIDILNEDFQAIAGSLGENGTNARIRFRLADVDPNGAPTSGITYSTNNGWYNDSGNYWSPLAWDTNRYLNIYTNAPPCCYGYVEDFPQTGVVGEARDRVVLWWEAVGRQPTPGWPGNRGRTATHEVGHYLGLYHTFCGGCGSASNCYGTGDLICDTNGQASSTSGCVTSSSSCGSSDPTSNYMDYTDDACLTEFTPEQVNRMRCILEHWRPDVSTCVFDVGTPYCTAVPNSSGSSAELRGAGSNAVPDNDIVLTIRGTEAGSFGILFYGTQQNQSPLGQGTLCVGGSIFRVPPTLQSDAGGTVSTALDLTQGSLASGAGAAAAGASLYFQYWFRDLSSTGFGLSDGLTIAFAP